jgi:hypothetical protein
VRLAAALVVAALPVGGSVVPGVSLGGIRLGDSQRRVRAVWGSSFGVCSTCAQETWYFNYVAYAPQGAGVQFSRRRVVAVFTLWQPTGWRTPSGLATGDPQSRITTLYGTLPRTRCGTYDAFLLRRRATVTAFYVVAGKVWGFGLSRRGVAACR